MKSHASKSSAHTGLPINALLVLSFVVVSLVPISKGQSFYPDFNLTDGVRHIQAVATKAGIIRTEDTFEGIIAKGVGPDYDWTAFREFLTEGQVPDYSGDLGDDVLISRLLANRLNLGVDSVFNSLFLKDEDPSRVPNRRRFRVAGIFDSGFEEFDATYVLTDIRHIQRMYGWFRR